jgi:two-component system OmpR family response regulator
MTRGKVLILDDDEIIVAGLTEALEEEGVAAAGTTSPFELPFLLRREQPDVVLVDLGIPALSGERVLELLTPSLRGRTRFLVFSGHSGLDTIAAATGAVDYVNKSEDFSAIIRRILFWVGEAQGRPLPRIEPHVAVVSSQRGTRAAALLRYAGYYVTSHGPSEQVAESADCVVVDAPRVEALKVWQTVRHRMPAVIVTSIPSLYAGAVTVAPHMLGEEIICAVDRAVASAAPQRAVDCVA